ncbi:MAG: hypothetical protein ACOC34_00715 [Thermotogota bacterium]
MRKYAKLILGIAAVYFAVLSFGVTYEDYIISNKLDEAYSISQFTEKCK